MHGPLLLSLLSGLVANAQADPDIRVAKSHKDRGYNSVRISVVDKGADNVDAFFDYNAKFQRAWSDWTLHTTVKPVPGGSATFTIGGSEVKINLPKQGGQARCLFIADLCFNSLGGGGCSFGGAGKPWDMEARFTEAVIDLVGSDEIHCWGILGDNFYENCPTGQAGCKTGGGVSKKFFESLPLVVKAKPFITIPGNHDFALTGLGTPASLDSHHDQGGYGFTQMYAQDVEFSLKDAKKPYDFSKPIGGPPNDPNTFPNQDNFIFSHQIGDIGFLGWSGTSRQEDFTPYLTKFCSWIANEATINTAVLVTHWNELNAGCSALDGIAVYNTAKGLSGCKDKTLLFFDGHQHCNYPHAHALENGFMIGGAGQWGGSGGGCKDVKDNGDAKRNIHQQWGFLVLDSDPNGQKGNASRVDYFEVQNTIGQQPPYGAKTDNWPDMSKCFKANKETPVTSCRDKHAFGWRARPEPAPGPPPGPPGPVPTPAPASGTTTTPLKAGDMVIPGTFVGFEIGDEITIEAGSEKEEDNKIIGFGSLKLKTPLKFAHDAGVTVSAKAAPSGPVPGDGPSALLIGGIVAAVLVVASIIIFIVVSRRKQSEGLLNAGYPDALEVSGGQNGINPAAPDGPSLQPIPGRG